MFNIAGIIINVQLAYYNVLNSSIHVVQLSTVVSSLQVSHSRLPYNVFQLCLVDSDMFPVQIHNLSECMAPWIVPGDLRWETPRGKANQMLEPPQLAVFSAKEQQLYSTAPLHSSLMKETDFTHMDPWSCSSCLYSQLTTIGVGKNKYRLINGDPHLPVLPPYHHNGLAHCWW